MFVKGILLIFVAGLFQGTWALGVKKSDPLSWESLWAPFSLIGMLIIPVLWTSLVVYDFLDIYRSVSISLLLKPVIFGTLWGIGAVTFGLAIRYIGMSLSYGINMGVASAVGALIPFFQIENLSGKLVTLVLAGTIIMVAGVIMITIAGILRDKLQNSESGVIVKEGNTRLGIIFALIGGLSTAAFNIGFSAARPIIDIAANQGATISNASLLAWILVLSGGFIINFGYAVFLIFRNKSYKDYRSAGSTKALLKVVATAAMWFAAIGIYGQGAAIMGNIGPVIGWVIFMALALVVSNLWGLKTGEWKNLRKPKKYLLIGNIILVISWIILGCANAMGI
jgi:L-rhamnose-H+ transport protein